MKKILLIGPFPQPISGVSLANLVLHNGIQNKGIKTGFINTEQQSSIKGDTGSFSFNKLKFFLTYFDLYKIPFYTMANVTIGQTFWGVLKYLPFLIVAKIFNRKVIIHLHGGFLKNEYSNHRGLKKKLMLLTLKQFDYGIVLSESLKEHLSFFLQTDKIFICKNFFEKSLVSTYKKKNYNEVRLIFLSNLIEGKGINLLVEALKNIDSSQIKIKIAGNIPPDNIEIREEMEKLPNLEYLGVVSGIEKSKMLEWGNVFCLPTFYDRGEGQPISIIEAMAFGNLILTTKHGGIPDICSDENAIFVEKNNLTDLINKINFLIENSLIIEKKGELNKKYAHENFTENVFINTMIEIFDKCKI